MVAFQTFVYRFGVLAVFGVLAGGGPLTAAPILSLPFNNTLVGDAGEAPTTATGTSFVGGIGGGAVALPTGSVLRYASAGNINSSVGTLEFVVTPNWNGNDGQNHAFLTWGSGGGMFFGKDAANNLRGIFRRFSVGGPELQPFSVFNVASWKAGEAHYVVFTWDDTAKFLGFYLDGQFRSGTTYTGTLPLITATTIQIGGDSGPGNLNGQIDELRIHDSVLSANEVAQRFASFQAVPEPGSLMILGCVLSAGCVWTGRHRRTRPHG